MVRRWRAPRAVPIEIVNKLNADINMCLTDAKLDSRIAELGDVATTRHASRLR